jgi:hypothetical protein
MNRRLFLSGVVAVLLALPALPALAHHGWGGNEDAEYEMTGTVVTPVSLAGPHATMQVKDKDGNTWDVTLAPPAGTQRAGVTEKTFPVGAMVMLHGHRNKDHKKFEIKTERVTYNGKVFNVYPDRT